MSLRISASILSLLFVFAAPARAQVLDRVLTSTDGGLPIRWPRAPQLDHAREVSGLSVVHAEDPAAGDGAVVCVVDSGLDLRHEDFRRADGSTRVRMLLDLDAGPRGMQPVFEERFGAAVWDRASIDAALATSDPTLPRDPHGHGTAVTAVAAGDGGTVGVGVVGTFAGAAPAAEIVVVRALRRGAAGFADADVLLGVEFCVAALQELPMSRLVVLLALSGHDGLHDGTEPLELALADLANSGVRIVVAAGNHGGRSLHASAVIYDAETVEIDVVVPEPQPPVTSPHVALVAEPIGAGHIEVSLAGWDSTATRFVDAASADSLEHATGRLAVRGAAVDGASRRAVYAAIESGAAPLTGGTYRLRVRGAGRFGVWLVGADVGAVAFPPRLSGALVSERATVGIPGLSPELITVGAWRTRPEVPTDAGSVRIDGQDASVTSWSAVGPAPNGVAKPDLVAPGAVITALSSDVDPADPTNLFGGRAGLYEARRVGPDRIAVTGTSIAAALVAGTIAVRFGRGASGNDAAWLRSTAEPLTDDTFTPWTGAGALRADRFLGTIESDAQLVVAAPSHRLLTPRFDAYHVLVRALRDGAPLERGEIVLRGADWQRSGSMQDGWADVPAPPLTGRLGARETIGVELDGTRVADLELTLVAGAARRRAPARASGGGCAASGPVALLPGFIAVMVLRRSGRGTRKTRR